MDRRRGARRRTQLAAPTPLLAGELLSAASQRAGGRLRPGDSAWPTAAAHTYARAALSALDLADELCRSAARLAAVGPKLRAKGKGRALKALVEDDAISAKEQPVPDLSDRSQRRLFERLVALGGARGRIGHATFRLYGL